MHTSAFAPGKIILSGEYAVVFGYKGIAVPASIGVTATYESSASTLVIDAGRNIPAQWKQYIEAICSHVEVKTGKLSLEIGLPLGKGMGSSTAVVIAICRAVLGESCMEKAKQIEDEMNPGNSGLDFAVIWEAKPLVFQKGKSSYPLPATSYPLANVSLIDTGTPNETTPELVTWITSRKDEPSIAQALATIGNCTERIIAGESPMTVFPDHHRAQVALGIVPEATQKIVADIEKKGGAAKVIGAGGRTGGGGMVLAFHRT